MNIQSLADLPQMQLVLDMQRDLSAARTEDELIYHFATRLNRLSGATLLLDLEVAGLADGHFRLRDRIAIGDPHFSVSSARRNSRWDEPADAVPEQTSPALSPLILDPAPKLARGVRADTDRDLLGDSGTEWDVLAVPVYHQGRLAQWLALLAPAGTPVDPVQLRTGISNLNLFSRAVVQFRLDQQVRSLTSKLELGLGEVARIQRSILPEVPHFDGLEIAVHYRPAAIAGGDYYDFRIFEDGRLGIAIADVAGHGPGAAVVMAMLRTIMSSYRLDRSSPDSVVRYANRLLVDGLTAGSFVTAVFIVLDAASGQAGYFNCGHCLPRLVPADGDIVTLDRGGAPPLGILEDLDPPGERFELGVGDAVVLYTDGITEAPARSGGERFGLDRLDAILRLGLSPAATVEEMARALDQFSGQTPRRDDECALIVKRIG